MRKRLIAHNLAGFSTPVDPEAIARTTQQYQAGKWRRNVIRPLLMTALVLAMMIGILTVIETISLDIRWMNLLPFFLIVIFEAIATTLWMRHPDRLILDRNMYRAAELFLLFVFARLISAAVFDEGLPDRELLQLYLRNPLPFFLNAYFLITFLLTVIAWRLAIIPAATFSKLALSQYEIRYYSLPLAVRKARADDQPIETARSRLTDNFTRYWLWGGLLLIVCLGISSIELIDINRDSGFLDITRLELPPLMLGAILVYFIGGFWLLSEARLSTMNAHWLINDVVKNPGIERKWQQLSLLFLLGVAFIAAFIPIGSTLPISRLLNLIIYAVMLIINLIIFGFGFILTIMLTLLSMLFPGQSESLPSSPPAENFNPQPPPVAQPLDDTAVLVFSSAFWTAFVVIVILALLFFLRERKNGLQREQVTSSWAKLRQWLHETWGRFWLRLRGLSLSIPLPQITRQSDPGSPTKSRRWRFVRVNALSPRDQIRYFYLSAVRRAGKKGVKRDSSETPLEFVEDLKSHWPEAEEDVTELTDAFLKARYSPETVQKEDVQPVKQSWKQVRASMRQPEKKAAEEENE